MLTPASTDAVNRAARLSYEEATGITQTVRNYSASLGFAIPGTTLVSELRSRITASLIAQGAWRPSATAEASKISQTQGASGSAGVASIPYFIRLDFAYASRTVFDAMAAMIAVGAVVDFLGLEQGLQRAPDENLELASAEVHR